MLVFTFFFKNIDLRIFFVTILKIFQYDFMEDIYEKTNTP